MDSPHDTHDDVSALAWVQDELRKSLDTAHKALRRTLKDTESTYGSDLDDVEPAQLRAARQQIHQGVGVLELVGLPAGAALLRGSEAAVQRFIAKPHKLDLPAVETIERASFALLDYLARRLAGKAVSPLALFPQYRAVHELAGAERIHPADLWSHDWQWHAIAPEDGASPRRADAGVVAEFESLVLASMRQPGGDATRRLSDLSADLAAGSDAAPTATLWRLAAAFFETQSRGLLAPDVHAKRMSSRLLAQLRGQLRGDATAGERLARDLLFFCAQAAGGETPRLAAVRTSYPVARDAVPTDYDTVQLGRYDPAWVTQARKRVATAKDSWSAVAAGEMHRLPGLAEQFSLVADSLRRLIPEGERLGDALSRAIGASVQSASAPAAPLAMETATSVLYLEAALEDGSFDQPEQAERVRRLAQRIDAVLAGGVPEPLEPWMEELYRRVSDRQTMGSVVQELRAALSEAEKLIDQFFRAPADPAVLIPVPAQLQAMRGVMSVLGLDHATHAVLRMRDDVDALVAAGSEAQHQQPLFERLAGNLSALSFLIDLLGVQPQAAKSLFRFDPASGLLSSQLGRRATPLEDAAGPRLEPALIARAQTLSTGAAEAMPLADVSREIARLAQQPGVASQPDLVASLSSAQAALGRPEAAEPAVREQVAGALATFVSTASDPIGLEPVPAATPLPPLTLATAPAEQTTGLEGDDEMLDVFLEEAREVLDTARGALAALGESPGDVEQLTTVRRSFHTFKGSSRMVGLREFGDAAWACEQLYNDQLASQQPASEPLLRLSGEALDHLATWIEAIAAGTAAGRSATPLRRSADAMRLEGRHVAVGDEPVPPAFVLPSAGDLDLGTGLGLPALADDAARDAAAVAVPAGLPPALEPAPGLDFSFDLGDEAPAVAAPADAAAAPLPIDLSAFDLSFDAAPTAAPATAASVPTEPSAALPAEAEIDPFATQPMPLGERPDAGLPELPALTGFDLELPAAAPTASEAVIESLQPSGDLPASFEALTAAPDLVLPPDVEFTEVVDSATTPFEPGELVETLQPSALGEFAASELPVEPAATPEPEAEAAERDAASAAVSEQVKVVGPLQISIPLFNIFLNEADELSRRLGTELAEWAHELHRPIGEAVVAQAHSLAGSSATVGFADLSALARQLEHALAHSQALGRGEPDDAAVYLEVADELRRLLHQFAAGFLKQPNAELVERLAALERELVRRLEVPTSLPQELSQDLLAAPAAAAEARAADTEPAAADLPEPVVPSAGAAAVADLGQADFKPLAPLVAEPQRAAPVTALDSEEDVDAVDAVDADLFPFFEEEAQDLLPELSLRLRGWAQQPGVPSHATAAMRTLHTLKGGARLAGAMRLGELAHRLETAIEHVLAHGQVAAADVEQLLGRADGLNATFEALRQRDALAYAAAEEAVRPLSDTSDSTVVTTSWPPLDAADEAAAVPDTPEAPSAEAVAEPEAPAAAAAPAAPASPAIDWSRFAAGLPAVVPVVASERSPLASVAAVRVRTQLLDRMVNEAGEVSIARARLEAQVSQIKNSLGDLNENLDRLRGQLRDIELQAETQMSTRMEAAKAAAQAFDPLEFDRFTRFQELTRMMAESVNDVATVQRTLQRTLESAEDDLAEQARLTRDLQDDLLRTRMVEFEGLSDRLYRVVRQAAKETGKQVRLDLIGGSIEVDRGVLDRMTGAFEHLLRNSVTHGIEAPEQRAAAGKDAVGTVVVSVHQEGNEVSVEFRDDGAGLDLPRIRERGLAMGLIDAAQPHGDAELANLIFAPGFSTADRVTELAGRGVGMDVVRSEVNALGGRIETASAPGQGTSFRLILPLTTAVTQVVMLRSGDATVAVPATLVELVRRANTEELATAYATGLYPYAGHSLPFFWLGALLQLSRRGTEMVGRSLPVVVVRSAQQRVALHVDEVLGNQEVVVKNLGPQLSRLPGLAGMTLLASGSVALIYNPVALATVYGEAAHRAMAATPEPAELRDHAAPAAPVASAPLVMVVDDSLTVRRVTQRLLVREGYRVVLAKDGLEALERLAGERPSVVLSDIEMPRMDGFDLVRNIRADAGLAALPVIMITSRIAQKHRDYASELGVNHYLGKPYSEEELLALIARYCTAPV